MSNLLLVMFGGAAGAGLRYGANLWTAARWGSGFPWGTLLVNLAGGLAMGLLAALVARDSQGQLVLGTGLLGGFTTFSAFSLDMAGKVERGEIMVAFLYALISVAGSLALLFFGLWLGRAVAA